MLKEKIPEGSPAYFDGEACEVVEVLTETRLKLSMPVEDGELRLPPLYMQGWCRFIVCGECYDTTGEVIGRYKSENRHIMEIELKTGLYRTPVYEEPVVCCKQEIPLFLGKNGEIHLEAIAEIISAKEIIFELADGQTLSPECMQAGMKAAAVTIWQMRFGGRIAPEKEQEEDKKYKFVLDDFSIEKQKKLTEILLLGQNNG